MHFKHESPRKDDRKKNDESRQGFLEPSEFCRLLLSRRQLVRFQSVEGVLGLLDPLTEEKYQVEETTLDGYAEQQVGS